MIEDALALELKKHDTHMANIRPTTTGDLNDPKPPQKLRLGDVSRSRVLATLAPTSLEKEAPNKEVVRPHAPRSKPTKVSNSSNDPEEKEVRKIRKSLRKPKTQSISELLDNLHHFDQTNLSRTLNTNNDDVDDEIHYVNIISQRNSDSKQVEKRKHDINSNNKLSGKSKTNPSISRRVTDSSEFSSSSSFTIPELPRGKTLTFNILSTWGDPHYVGLMGIEIFDNSGHLVKLTYPERQIWADPPDINILAGYGDDPRTVDNLVDGVNHTCDDLHAWLAPFTSGRNHIITIDMDMSATISLIRIWNYNKSRIHSHRGARYVEIELDNRCIFKGEIKQAPGVRSSLNYEDCCECILFTTNSSILNLIERYDNVLSDYNAALKEQETSKHAAVNRPLLFDISAPREQPQQPSFQGLSSSEERPTTQAGRRDKKKLTTNDGDKFLPRDVSMEQMNGDGDSGFDEDRVLMSLMKESNSKAKKSKRPSTAAIARQQQPARCRVVEICVLSNWGDQYSVGITSIVGVNEFMEDFVLPVPLVCICDVIPSIDSQFELCNYHEVGLEYMTATPDVMVDGTFQTTNSMDMWSMPRITKGNLVIRFDLKKTLKMKGLRLCNFNMPGEGSAQGIKHVQIYLDGKLSTQLLVRKAPGVANMDYTQFLPLFPLKSASLSKSCVDLLEGLSLNGNGANSGKMPQQVAKPPSNQNPTQTSVQSNRKLVANNNEYYQKTATSSNWSAEEYSTNSMESSHASNGVNSGKASNWTAFNGGSMYSSNVTCPVQQQYETPVHPSGCMVKLVINSTHGDRYYVGLNGFELFDDNGYKIDIDPSQLQAFPYRDINDLEEIRKQGLDCRRLENLINLPNDTFIDQSMWLAPFSGPNSAEYNAAASSILIMFDEPIALSCIKIWNYSKTPDRGAKDIEIFLDDVLLFSGSLLPSPRREEMTGGFAVEEGGINWGTLDSLDLSQAILFTNRTDIIEKEQLRVPMGIDDIEFIDEGQLINPHGRKTTNEQIYRPMTSASGRY